MLQLGVGLRKFRSLCVSWCWISRKARGPPFDAPPCVIGQLVPRDVLVCIPSVVLQFFFWGGGAFGMCVALCSACYNGSSLRIVEFG